MRRAAVLRAGIMVLLLALFAAGGLALWGYDRFTRPGPLAVATVVIIPKGSGVEAIAQRLGAAAVIGHPVVFMLAVRIEGRDRLLRAGEFEFPPWRFYWPAGRRLSAGSPLPRG